MESELEKLFNERISPYEERIKKLEDIEKHKEMEISTLKHAIHHLNQIIENIKNPKPIARTPISKPGNVSARDAP